MPRSDLAGLGLKCCAGRIRGAICLVRSNANAACIALIGAVVISAISYVTSYALDMLGAIVAAFILLHFFVHSSFSFLQELFVPARLL